MNIIELLSSRTGDKTSTSNKAAAAKCLANPILLNEIAVSLDAKDVKLAGDCAEVMTMVAQEDPALVVPYSDNLLPLLRHKNTRCRWEAMHAFALVAGLAPRLVHEQLHLLESTIENDTSTIVRDYAVNAVAAYAGVDSECAHDAFPILLKALRAWDGKLASRALEGIQNAVKVRPGLKGEAQAIGEEFMESPRAVTKKAAAKLLRSLK